MSLVNIVNYAFHVVVSRQLGPADYGALGSVLALVTVLSLPISSIQTAVAKTVADDRTERSVAGSSVQAVVVPAALVTLLSIFLVPLLGRFLRIDMATAAMVALYVLPATIAAAYRGVLQGSKRFGPLAVAIMASVGLRFAFGTALVAAGFGVAGAMAATVIGELGLAAIAIWTRKSTMTSRETVAQSRKFLWRETRPTAVGLGIAWLLIEADLILARHVLTAGDAGNYAAAGLLARIPLFLTGAIALIALPHFAESRGRGEAGQRWLRSYALLTVLCGASVALVLWAARTQSVALTFGDAFSQAARLVPPLSVAMVAFALTSLFVLFHLAAGSRAFLLFLGCMIVYAAVVVAAVDSALALAAATVANSVVVTLIGFVSCRSLAFGPVPYRDLPRTLSVHRGPVSAADDVAVTVVTPCYNVGPRLLEQLHPLVDVLERSSLTFEVIVVSDGSTDGSHIAAAAAGLPVEVVHYERRQGKGVAIKTGMARARGRYVAFVDGDGDIDPSALSSFLDLIQAGAPDIVIGSKRHPASSVEYPGSRRLMSAAYHGLVRLLFRLPIRDSQAGMKLIRRQVLDAVLPRMLEKRFAFDLEFLVVARLLGFERVVEAPIQVRHRLPSTVDLRSATRILIDTAAVFYRRYILRSYSESPASPTLPTWEELPIDLGSLQAAGQPSSG